MSKKSRKEYQETIRERYHQAERIDKQKILDEFCQVCGYNRKYAIRILNQPRKIKRLKKPGRPRHYHDPQIMDVLMDLWRVLNLPCSRRLKASIPLWLPHYEEWMEITLPKETKEKLLSISPATIDRLMAHRKVQYTKLGLATTKPGSILKSHIPINTTQWDENRPGFLEADTVAHCGTSVAGSFVYTVNSVDIATGWSEQRAVWGKGYQGMKEALIDVERVLPFKIRGFDSDNGSEFLNWHIYRYFNLRAKPVSFTRSRPYRKNDNAHIEEKNWSIVRQYLGYNRFESPDLTAKLNDIYTQEWRLLMNFFRPAIKLIAKQRNGAKIKKIYDKPRTPYQRIMESKHISRKTKTELTQFFRTLNPFKLQNIMENKIKCFLKQTTPLSLTLSGKILN